MAYAMVNKQHTYIATEYCICTPSEVLITHHRYHLSQTNIKLFGYRIKDACKDVALSVSFINNYWQTIDRTEKRKRR